MFPRLRHLPLLPALLCVLVPSVSLSQSALSLWDNVVDHPEFSEAELLRLAQFTKAELSLFETHLDLCQEVQPEGEDVFAEVKAHFEAIGAPVVEFLGRYSNEQLEALGVPNDDRFQVEIDQQSHMLRAEFPRLDDEWQRNSCADLRSAILAMEPKASVTRF